uniref:Reverse transcriptase n=1 Tax=Cyprinus carpio TaxID=7962 RepID=A0A8C2Q875_CYPCA
MMQVSGSIDDVNNQITSAMIMAAEEAIPKTRSRANRKLVPWWNEECQQAVRDRNKAFRKLKRTHNVQHLMQYKKEQAIVRRKVRQAKRSSWRNFCDEIGRTTPVGEVWGMIKRMGGDRRKWEYPVMVFEEETAVSNKEKAEMMAKSFTRVHSSENLSEVERRRRSITLNQHLNEVSRKEETGSKLDEPFTLAELIRAIKRAKHTSPGKDQVCYLMLKQLGEESLLKLLEMYNKIWKEGKLPGIWKEAIVIPIRKLGKDPTNPISYRPIALTSNLCKVMERMIADRLTYVLEKRGLLAKCQSGFRKGRSTIDSVVRLETEIRKAQANRESVIAVFFDIEKAYDMMWKEGLLIKLSKIGVEGRVFNWIRDFLFGRKIQIRIGADLSDQYIVDNGTPQGSVISPLLFIIMINDVFGTVPEDIGRSLFADDGALWKKGRNIEYVTRKIQEAIDIVVEWGYNWGFRFSIEKTQSVFFTRKRIQEGLKLRMYGRDLEKVGTFKFLGINLDSRLTFAEHIRRIEEKCKRVINVMRCLRGKEWGASRLAMKKIYMALIRSVLDYGCVVFGSAAQSLLKKLDVIQAQALRLCCGAFKTTPVSALQVEIGECPLEIRRKQLMANYWAGLQGHNDSHPTKAMLQESWEYGKRKKENFGRIGNDTAKELGVFNLRVSCTVVYPEMAPWKLVWPEVDWYVLEEKRRAKGGINLKMVFNNRIAEKYNDYTQVYTDGAKEPETEVTGLSVVVPSKGIGINRRTSNMLGVYTVEMLAILIAVRWVEKSGQHKVLVCSDSSSVLASIRSFYSKSRQDILYEVLQSVTRIFNQGRQIQFVWVPGHVGIRGNELADKLAKTALSKGNIEMQVSISKAEVKSVIWKTVNQMWQERWDREGKGRQLYQIQRDVKCTVIGSGNSREETVISRLRLGHCLLNKTLKLIGKHDTGLCEVCKEEESVEHVVFRCSRYDVQRELMRNKLREIEVQDMTLKGLLSTQT